MSDAKSKVDMARVALRRAIASAMVRKEQAEEAIGRLKTAIELRTQDRMLAESAGDTSLVADIDQRIADFERQFAVHDEALALADNDIASLKEELQGMDGLEREAERLEVLAPIRDADGPSVTQSTLDRVRDSIQALDTEASVNDELLAAERLERRIEVATAEAAAKAKLAELKAQHALRKASEPSADADGDAAPPAPKKPKRTM